jgi:AcrR family transcriptional regulator
MTDERPSTAVADALPDEARIQSLLASEFGEEMATAFALARHAQERWAGRRHPDEGLRERKKRRTRQQISDVATVLFAMRGFDHVTVAQVADVVGVSEKTVYNYFPTKESLVFDRTDETLERMVIALRERSPGESATRAVLRALDEDMRELEELPEELYVLLPLFAEMVATTPALRAAWLELHGRLVEVATDELAALAEVDPRDPEPMIAARAIGALHELAFTSNMRHIVDGLRGRELRAAVVADLERAAKLLDAGLWSFNMLTQGVRTRQQLRDAAVAADDARRQVFEAIKQARTAWRALRRSGRDEARRGRADGRRGRAQIRQAAREVGERAAYEAFRHAMQKHDDAMRALESAQRGDPRARRSG